MTSEISIIGAACFDGGRLACLRQDRIWALPGDVSADGALFDTLPTELAGTIPAIRPGDAAEGGAVRHFPASRLIADCVAVALADAGLTVDAITGSHTGFVSGSHYGCVEFLETLRSAMQDRGPRAIKPTDFSIATHGYPMAALGMAYGATGPATAFVGGETASFEAMAFAELMMRIGQADRMVVVGYEIGGRRSDAHRRCRDADDADAPMGPSVVCLVLHRGSGLARIEELGTAFIPDRGQNPGDGQTRPWRTSLHGLFALLSREDGSGMLSIGDPMGGAGWLKARRRPAAEVAA